MFPPAAVRFLSTFSHYGTPFFARPAHFLVFPPPFECKDTRVFLLLLIFFSPFIRYLFLFFSPLFFFSPLLLLFFFFFSFFFLFLYSFFFFFFFGPYPFFSLYLVWSFPCFFPFLVNLMFFTFSLVSKLLQPHQASLTQFLFSLPSFSRTYRIS